MLFAQFVASKIKVDDANNLIGGDEIDGPTPAWIYAPYYEKGNLCGGFWIAIGHEGTAQPVYHLLIGNQEWESQDLADLEGKLWDYFADGETNGSTDTLETEYKALLGHMSEEEAKAIVAHNEALIQERRDRGQEDDDA